MDIVDLHRRRRRRRYRLVATVEQKNRGEFWRPSAACWLQILRLIFLSENCPRCAHHAHPRNTVVGLEFL